MNNKKKTDIENKYKDTTEKFLNFMKEARLRDKINDEKEESSQKIDSSSVTNFVQNLTFNILRGFNKVNYWVDIMLASSKRIKLLSLFMAITLCYFVNGGSGITTTKSIDYINDVVVNIMCDDGYHVIGNDKTVTIQLIGDYGSIQWAKLMDDYRVVLNVEGKTEGNYDVTYTIEGISSNLDVQILPDKTNVNISKKETRTYELDFRFTNRDKVDSALILKDPKLAFMEVDITAGTTTLDRIDQVVASIDVAEIKQSVINQKADIVALDANGNELDVKISQNKVNYDLEVVSYSKQVPIQLETRGEVNSNFILMGLTPSISTVTIYGLEEDIETIEHVVAIVDVDGKTSNVTIEDIQLIVPDGVTKVSNKTISVDCLVEQKLSKIITNVPIEKENVSDHFNVRLIAGDTTSVRVTGPKSKVDPLNANTLKIYIDLTNATTGTAKYNLIIANQDEQLIYQFTNGTSVDVAITGN